MTDTAVPAFHLAIPVDDLASAADFYGSVLGCERGRSSTQWIDWNFFGHQLVTHRVAERSLGAVNDVDGDRVPVPHFGVVLEVDDFCSLADRLSAQDQQFVIPPRVRFAGLAGEQRTMFLYDPAGNALEFKAFADPAQLFATE